MTHTLTYTLTRDDEEIELELEYSMSPYTPARGPSWSSPGEPAEGGEIDDLEITRDGEPFELTTAEIEQAEEWIYDKHDYDADDYEDF